MSRLVRLYRFAWELWGDLRSSPPPLGTPYPEPLAYRFGPAVVVRTHPNHLASLAPAQARRLAAKLFALAADSPDHDTLSGPCLALFEPYLPHTVPSRN